MAITVRRLCCRAIHLNVGKKPETVSTKRLVRAGSCPRATSFTQNGTCHQPPNPAMTPAGAPGKPWIRGFINNAPRHYTGTKPTSGISQPWQRAPGENPGKGKEGPVLLATNGQGAPLGKGVDSEPTRTRTTLMAAFMYQQKNLNPMSRHSALGKTQQLPAFFEKITVLRTT